MLPHLHPPHFLAALIPWNNANGTMLLVFGFVILLVVIKRLFRLQREKMWHDTARIALDKGQPLPARETMPGSLPDCGWLGGRFFNRYGHWGAWAEIRRGLILIAVSIGLYYALPAGTRAWVAIPACVGAANLIMGVIAYFWTGPNDRRDPPSPGKP